MTQRRRRAPQTRRAPIEPTCPSGNPPADVTVTRPAPEPAATIDASKIFHPDRVRPEMQHAPEESPRIRLVRFRFGWGYEDTAPAIVFDEQIAVLLPPKTPIAKGAQLTFRAPDGGWSIGKARPGDGIGEYQEV